MGVSPLLRGNRFPQDWTHLPTRVAKPTKDKKKGKKGKSSCANCPLVKKWLTPTHLFGNDPSLHTTLLPTQKHCRYLFQCFSPSHSRFYIRQILSINNWFEEIVVNFLMLSIKKFTNKKKKSIRMLGCFLMQIIT